jgi:hypothetical protein
MPLQSNGTATAPKPNARKVRSYFSGWKANTHAALKGVVFVASGLGPKPEAGF